MSTQTAKNRPAKEKVSHSIVAVDKFIRATRDSGYKGTPNAVAEIVDNAIQAEAEHIQIFVVGTEGDQQWPIEICVCDDGVGMDPFTLRQALRFGGSSRFGDREGLGRYGMGLPNSSLSQARVVTVFSWKDPDQVFSSYLDVDEIASGEMIEVPVPQKTIHPLSGDHPKTGTIVSWTACDRLDNLRISTIERKLAASIGRRFRHFLWDGLRISINGVQVEPVDPLFLHPVKDSVAAKVFGGPIEYEVRVEAGAGCKRTGRVQVIFSELPVHELHALSNEEKRRKGISKGAGVSIVRGGREVDYGWFFMGSKRRENYDDWWRCEIRFDPVLDEVFGITHTKQQIRPLAHLLEVLVPDMEAAARALNSRARKAYLAVKAAANFSDAERIIAERESALKPLPAKSTSRDKKVLKELKRIDPSLRGPTADSDSIEYRVLTAHTPKGRAAESFFDHANGDGRFVLTINPDHPFYKKLYRPLEQADGPSEQVLKAQVELLLLSMSREFARATPDDKKVLDKFRSAFSQTLATLLDGK